jgi:hypothetical protein
LGLEFGNTFLIHLSINHQFNIMMKGDVKLWCILFK